MVCAISLASNTRIASLSIDTCYRLNLSSGPFKRNMPFPRNHPIPEIYRCLLNALRFVIRIKTDGRHIYNEPPRLWARCDRAQRKLA